MSTTRSATSTQSVSMASNILNARSTDECTETVTVLTEYIRNVNITPSQAKKAILEEICVSDIMRASADAVRQLKNVMDAKGGACKMPDIVNVRNAVFVYLQQNGGDTIPLDELAKSAASSASTSIPPTVHPDHDPAAKAKNEFAKYYYDDNKKFVGSSTGIAFADWKRDLVSNFDYYKISNEERKSLLDRTISGKVKDFYLNSINPRNMSWQESVDRLGAEFVPESLRANDLRRFTSHSFEDVRRENPNLSSIQAFDKLLDELRGFQKNLAQQYRGEEALRDMVMRAMIRTDYSPFFAIYSSNRSEDLFARIRSVIQSVDGSSLATKNNSGTSTILMTKDDEAGGADLQDPTMHGEEPADVLFQRMLRRYERNKRFKKRFGGNYIPRGYGQALNPPGDDGKPQRCHKCDSKMHRIKDCPHSDENLRRALLTETSANGNEIDEGIQTHGDETRDEDSDTFFVGCSEVRDLHRVEPFVPSMNNDWPGPEVFLTQDPTTKEPVFQGFCFDNGSSTSIASFDQFKAYCHHAGIKGALRKSSKVIRWGDLYPSMGSAQVRLPLDSGNFLPFSIEVIDTGDKIPPLILGLDAMEKFGITIKHDKTQPCFVIGDREYSLQKKFGHLYWVPPTHAVLAVCNLTQEELMAIHKKFGHASTRTIVAVFKNAKNPLEENDEDLLSRVVQNCDICQWYAGKPSTYKVSAEVETSFNHTVQADIMYINQQPVFHIVCKGTKLQAASFLIDKSSDTLWKAFCIMWIQHFDFPHRLQIDQDSAMTSNTFRDFCTSSGIILDVVPVEAHHSVGMVERYHGVLRTIFLKLKDEQQNAEQSRRETDELLLSYAVRAMNTSVGLEGFIPSLLVFGTVPKMVLRPDQPPHTQAQRISAMLLARKSYEEVISKQKLKQMQGSQIPSFPDPQQGSIINQPVLVRREEGHKWSGPYICIKVDKNKVFVLMPPSGRRAEFHINNVKKFVTNPPEPPAPILLSNEEMSKFETAKVKEIHNLWEKGTFSFATTIPSSHNSVVFGARFVLTIKSDGSHKARYVVQGHRDPQKKEIVTEAPTLSRLGIRLLSHLAATFNMLPSLAYRDYEQAYLQSTSPLGRDVYIQIRDEDKPIFIRLQKDLVGNEHTGQVYLHLNKPLYGLTEAGTYWYFSLSEKFVQAGFQEAAIDPCIMVKKSLKGEFQGALGLVVDDELLFGNPEMTTAEQAVSGNFINKGISHLPFTFDGLQFSASANVLRLSQERYIEKLWPRNLPVNTNQDEIFKTVSELRGQFIWLASSTRPDISFATAKLSQVTSKSAEPNHIKSANKVIQGLKAFKNLGLPFHEMRISDSHIRVYSDASFAANDDNTSQLGYLVFISDGRKMNLIHWQSLKSKVVLHSVLGAEVHALVTALDIAEALQTEIETMCGAHIPIVLLTDSKSIFDTIAHKSVTREKRLMVKIQILRQAYELGRVSDVAHIPGTENIANSLTKNDPKAQGTWHSFYQTGEINHSVNVWLKAKLAKEKSRVNVESSEQIGSPPIVEG